MAASPMSAIVEEIRRAYERVGIRLDQPAAYGTYYRLLCAGCGRLVGSVGDRLLPGMAEALVEQQLELYATGLLGCACGHQAERAALARGRPVDAPRAREAAGATGPAPAGDPASPPAATTSPREDAT